MPEYNINGSVIDIRANKFQASVQTEGYVSGVSAGTFLDRKTGARDLGFGLSIVDFLVEKGEDDPESPNAYHWGDIFHGNIPKRYVELPQICTQAHRLPYKIVKSDDFIAIKQWFRWTVATYGRNSGSLWEQILIFPENTRYFFSTDSVTSANTMNDLSLRIDMPGHLKHNNGDSFSQIYLSYYGMVSRDDFLCDFPPDARFRYVRGHDPLPERIIRAYQTSVGTWLAGMTLNPSDVSEAWCHQRGYVCFIEEVGRETVIAGDTFSAAYIIGFFDSISEMEDVYDQYRGCSNITLEPDFENANIFRLPV